MEQARTAPPTVALDNLQAMINLVLIQSGRYLREQQAGGGSGRNQINMKRAVPAALDRFQDSLDQLEGELHQAQAVLRRDLALLQADRLKREQAAAAERQRLAAESSAKKNVTAKVVEPPPKPTESVAKPQDSKEKDTAETAKTNEQPAALERADDPPPPISTAIAPPTERDPLFDGTPTTANAQDQEFDFDAMFGDIGDMGTDANNNANDSNDNTDQGDITMGDPQDLTFTLEDSGPSLLRGLEDFAKSSDDGAAGQAGNTMDLDFAMPDLPDLPTNAPPAQLDSKPAEQAQQDHSNDDAAMMTTDDLDELFNMDYENPENTEFDNAFFGYDES
ncbi:hypothetical protein K491DRAFT_693681 [Lophiostoma macrostomum CBS 122681]|uniref:Uncharacterized protein n=1 Tax=Lophiostoma macrostomum CBS 122681 TaxID=1314788 RepID=A0A6A6T6S7_9PLEO|nr:hypothetical protein K491DRAFT_693681 [Lophiostoma macrostomum CBS 122681]